MKMGVKLGLAFGVIVLLLVILAVTSVFELNSVNTGYNVDIKKAQIAKTSALAIVTDMLQVRRSEKDFLARLDMKYPERVNNSLDSANQKIKELLQTTDNQTVASKLKEAQENIATYRTVFTKLVAEQSKKGLNEKSGLQGEFRNAAHNLEATLNDQKINGADLLYLTLRKHEKDYLLRGNSKYVEKAHKTIATLNSKINASQGYSSAKNQTEELLTNYRKSFDALVTIDGQIVGLLKEMKQSADQAMAGSEEVAKSFTKLAAQRSNTITANAKTAITTIWVVGILSVLIAVVLAYFFARSISVPMRKTVAMILEMEKGHLATRLQLSRADEIGQMANAMDTFADSLQNEVVANLQKLATGDLTFEISPRDQHDEIRNAIKTLGKDLGTIVSQIQVAGEQIASGSGQVSDSSQSLSQGATEQASSLEEISASLNQLSSQTSTNAENANQASNLASEAQGAAKKGSQQMQTMVTAMAEINEAGQNISKIIKVIDEIAFQTNLLALNAAVEAARAGQHGKGFAVVAEEVRNLAARSAKAAAETAELIEGSVAKTENGSNIANQTSDALQGIVNGISKVTDLISEIAAASNEQAQGVTQINQGVTQIDQVTQQNTASAEESAAAAEELSGQAEQLRQMLGRFTLKHVQQSYCQEMPKPKPHFSAKESLGWTEIAQEKTLSDKEPHIALDDSEFGKF
jgi:methyl-accepting chemotaxis protein